MLHSDAKCATPHSYYIQLHHELSSCKDHYFLAANRKGTTYQLGMTLLTTSVSDGIRVMRMMIMQAVTEQWL